MAGPVSVHTQTCTHKVPHMKVPRGFQKGSWKTYLTKLHIHNIQSKNEILECNLRMLIHLLYSLLPDNLSLHFLLVIYTLLSAVH